jgi:hypothetical protein
MRLWLRGKYGAKTPNGRIATGDRRERAIGESTLQGFGGSGFRRSGFGGMGPAGR